MNVKETANCHHPIDWRKRKTSLIWNIVQRGYGLP